MIFAQGIEAGGHIKGTTTLSTIVLAIVEAVDPFPVIAARGISNGTRLVAALSLGARAVSLGTRFVASEEVVVTQEYNERIVNATADDPLHTFLFGVGWPGAAHRVLRNSAVEEWEAAGKTMELLRHGILPPMLGFHGDAESTALYAGEPYSLIHDSTGWTDCARHSV